MSSATKIQEAVTHSPSWKEF